MNSHQPHHVRLASLPGRLQIVEQIMSEAIRAPQIRPYCPRAQWTFFCGVTPEQRVGYAGQLEAAGRCLEWFTFDYKIPLFNLTPAQLWLKANKSKLSTEKYHQACECLDFISGIFVIQSVTPCELDAADLLRASQHYHITENIMTPEMHDGQLLIGRLFPHDEHYVISGMASLLSDQAAGRLRALIADDELEPEIVVDELDGITLENLCGRNLLEIDHLEDLDLLLSRLRYYVEEICPGGITYARLMDLLNNSDEPFTIAEQLCIRLDIECQFEMEVVLAYVVSAWTVMHQT